MEVLFGLYFFLGHALLDYGPLLVVLLELNKSCILYLGHFWHCHLIIGLLVRLLIRIVEGFFSLLRSRRLS